MTEQDSSHYGALPAPAEPDRTMDAERGPPRSISAAERVREAIARYDIRHPVVHDPEMTIWREYAVRAWPTLVFVAPDGSVLGASSGEPDVDKLIAFVEEHLASFAAKGFYAMATIMLVHTAITLTKTLGTVERGRDRIRGHAYDNLPPENTGEVRINPDDPDLEDTGVFDQFDLNPR